MDVDEKRERNIYIEEIRLSLKLKQYLIVPDICVCRTILFIRKENGEKNK